MPARRTGRRACAKGRAVLRDKFTPFDAPGGAAERGMFGMHTPKGVAGRLEGACRGT